MKNYGDTRWGSAEDFGVKYRCSVREARRWAFEGRVHAFHQRGLDGGWLFPLDDRDVDVKQLRTDDCKVDEAVERLSTKQVPLYL